ncbi:type I glyceraldehyde-3-phosphate dehydrogenase [Candidatus Dependentiae bacterium]|nr:type I glyceraldehyde-3-phosphate dehydrogenase [Candidatus Dependentiae bacterium]
MAKKIAINGFGRIGRSFLRALLLDEKASKDLNVVAINIGPGKMEQTALLFQYDSVMGQFKNKVKYLNNSLIIGNKEIKILSELDPEKLPWSSFNIDWVVEATGKFTQRSKAQLHLKAGAKKILITAPAKGEDVTIIPGINDSEYKSENLIVSLGSCTTNCFAPMIKVIDENFDLISGLMTTIHAYTNTQVLLDVQDSDPRRARAAAINLIPTSTGADKVITKLYPQYRDKLQALAVRAPIPIVSLIDFTFDTKDYLTVELINDVFKRYSQNQLKGILQYCEEPLVSSDFEQNSHSCIIDSLLTKSNGKMHKIFGWYDNEFGYSCRLKDFLLHN